MISHEYKCIFVHIPKSGGLSIQDKFLQTYSEKELLLGKNKNPKLGPPRFNHLMASEYVGKNHLTQEQFDAYFKFSFVRNPWARFVSLYHYLGYSRITDFNSFVFQYFEKELWNSKKWYWFVRPQYDYIYDKNNALMIDFLGKTENLQSDFTYACQQIGFDDDTLYHKNKSSEKSNFHPLFIKLLLAHPLKVFDFYKRETDKSNYKEYFNSDSKKLITKLYEIDIDTFKYKF